jgi:hypothetical protein
MIYFAFFEDRNELQFHKCSDGHFTWTGWVQLALRKRWCIDVANTLSYTIDIDYTAMEAEGAAAW